MKENVQQLRSEQEEAEAAEASIRYDMNSYM